MWPFSRQVRTPEAVLDQLQRDLQRLVDETGALSRRVNDLRDDHETLAFKHRSLQGRLNRAGRDPQASLLDPPEETGDLAAIQRRRNGLR